MDFTAHNIVLDDGTQTKPELAIFEARPSFRAVARCVKMIYPNGLCGIRVIDLACLEGGFAVGLARLGADVLGIEIRRTNFANCELVRSGLSLPNLKFVRDDVWNVAHYGEADVILCSGILYHLDRPKEFLDVLGRMARKAVLINTHFADEAINPAHGRSLSDIAEHEGLRGRWYAEPPARSEDARWSSWNNERSFWLTKPWLLQAITDAGFPMVFEQYDWLGDNLVGAMREDGFYQQQHRNLFVGVKP